MANILEELALEGRRSALLMVDMIRGYLDSEVAYHPLPPPDSERVVKGCARLLEVFRGRALPVAYTTNYGRRPTPWGRVDRRNPFLEWQEKGKRPIPGAKFPRKTGLNVEGAPCADLHPPVGPREGEIIVHKPRYDAFYGTDLETVLRGLGTENLFLCGINTNNCVLATSYGAFCRDFRVFLVEDACATWNGEDMHRFAARQVEAALGWVVCCEDVAAYLEKEVAAGEQV